MKHVIDYPLTVNWTFTVSEPTVTIKKSPWHRRWRKKMYAFIGISATSLWDKIEDEIAGEIVDKIVDLVELLGSYIQRFRTNLRGTDKKPSQA